MLAQFKKLARNSLIYSLGNVSTKILGFILLPIYTSHLTVTDYGILGILEVSAQFITAVFGLNLYRALVRWYWEKKDFAYQQKLFFTVLMFLVVFVLIFEVVFYIYAPYFSKILFSNIENTYLLRLMAVSAGLNIIFRIPLTLMRVQEKPTLYSVSNIIKLVVAAVLTIWFIVKLGKGIDGIYEAQIISLGVFFIILLPYIKRNIKFEFLSSTFWDMFLFSYPLVFASISGLLLTIADRFFLKFMSGLSDVGVYSLGFKIANSLKVFVVQSIMLALSPIIYKVMNEPGSRQFYARLMKYLGLLVMGLAVILSLYSHELVRLLARKPGYWSAEYVVPIIAMSAFFGMLKEIALTGINIKRKTKVVAFIITEVALLNLFLNYLLIPPFQSLGAASATLITQIILFLQIYFASQKYYKIPYDLISLMKLIAVGFIIVLFAFSIRNVFSYLLLVLVKIGFFMVFLLLLYIIGFFNKDELDKLKTFIVKSFSRK